MPRLSCVAHGLLVIYKPAFTTAYGVINKQKKAPTSSDDESVTSKLLVVVFFFFFLTADGNRGPDRESEERLPTKNAACT